MAEVGWSSAEVHWHSTPPCSPTDEAPLCSCLEWSSLRSTRDLSPSEMAPVLSHEMLTTRHPLSCSCGERKKKRKERKSRDKLSSITISYELHATTTHHWFSCASQETPSHVRQMLIRKTGGSLASFRKAKLISLRSGQLCRDWNRKIEIIVEKTTHLIPIVCWTSSPCRSRTSRARSQVHTTEEKIQLRGFKLTWKSSGTFSQHRRPLYSRTPYLYRRRSDYHSRDFRDTNCGAFSTAEILLDHVSVGLFAHLGWRK